jgi:multidrug resistance efflux pump
MPSLTPDRPRSVPSAQLAIPRPLQGEWSDEVRDIMTRPPSWLLRSGTGLLMGGVLILFLLGWFIHYPDMINARITLTGSTPVVDVVARQSGHLARLQVQEMQAVKKDDILAIVSNAADADTVIALSQKITPLVTPVSTGAPVPAQDFPPLDALGQIQSAYTDFSGAWNTWQSVKADDYAAKTSQILEGQAVQKRAQISGMDNQAQLATRERTLEAERYARMKALHQRDSISTAQLQEAEQQYIAGERLRETARKALAEEKISLATLEKEMADIRHQRSEALRLSRSKLQEALNTLRAQIDLWQSDYLLRAPADGVVAFHDFWSDQQYVAAGQVVFLIVPETTRLVGRMAVNQSGAGKIVKGQPVRIKLQDFPYKEFGLVNGRVQSISLVARDSAHLVLVDIDYPLTSSYGKPIPFKQQMAGDAGIITEDVRLIGRVFNEIRKAFAQSN